jgi:hypothetical protein
VSKKLPKEIFVCRRDEGTSDEYLLCAEDFAELAEMGEVTPAGRYQLVENVFVEAAPSLTKGRKLK